MTTPPKLFLLDAFALIYRAHFSFITAPRITSTGMNTSAVFGFANTLLDLLKNEKPSHIGVCFDTSAPTFRHEASERYKAHRQETPEDIIIAVPYVKRLLQAMHIPILEMDGYEADDIIGTVAHRAAAEGWHVYLMTPDKDCAQLVRDNVWLYRPGQRGNPPEVLDAQGVTERYGVPPHLIADLLGLKGDASDNIPGVPKVGEKTALQLIQEYGAMEDILANVDKITKKSIKETLVTHAQQGLDSKMLATIHTNVPFDWQLGQLTVDPPDRDAVEALFRELEFRSLFKRLFSEELAPTDADLGPLFGGDQVAPAAKATNKTKPTAETESDADAAPAPRLRTLAEVPHSYHLVDNQEKMAALVAQLTAQTEVCFDTETTNIDALEAEIVAATFAWQPGEAWFVPFPADRQEAQAWIDQLRPFWESPTVVKIGQNVKYDLQVLANYGVQLAGPIFDTMLAHYVVHATGKHNMDVMAQHYLQYRPISFAELTQAKTKTAKVDLRALPQERLLDYACEDADVTLQLAQALRPEVAEHGVQSLLETIEQPLVPVLAAMERAGVRVDVEFLKDYSIELQKEVERIEHDVYQKVGEVVNLNSPKQLGELLFVKLKLPGGKKTATGQWSTDEETLSKLAHEHELPAMILAYRELTKLKSTYVDALPTLVNPRTGRVHTSYNQAVAVTGRLSSNNPNLQNIPIRTDRGREVRKAFVAGGPDRVLLSADYSQIELRVMAAMSQDPAMIDAFTHGLDIHRATAARVFGVTPDAVTDDMRRKAKMVNFGIIYGITPFGLAQRLGIGRGEAGDIIAEYFRQYPRIQAFMQECKDKALERGFAVTLTGRRHYLPDIRSKNATVRGFAERNAINTPIQGTAADLMKLAMIRVQADLLAGGFATQMILQVHDELVFDALRTEVDTVRPIIIRGMSQAMDLGLPLEVEVGAGDNWLDAH